MCTVGQGKGNQDAHLLAKLTLLHPPLDAEVHVHVHRSLSGLF